MRPLYDYSLPLQIEEKRMKGEQQSKSGAGKHSYHNQGFEMGDSSYAH